jgi:hypothetical protein
MLLLKMPSAKLQCVWRLPHAYRNKDPNSDVQLEYNYYEIWSHDQI